MATRFIDVIFWIAVVSCACAQYFILRAVLRVTPQNRPSVPDTPGLPVPKRLTEVIWAVLPLVLLALAFAGAWSAMHTREAITARSAMSAELRP